MTRTLLAMQDVNAVERARVLTVGGLCVLQANFTLTLTKRDGHGGFVYGLIR